MDGMLTARGQNNGPWAFGFEPSHDGWELFFQSQVGFELTMLAVLPFPEDFRFYSSGQIENAIDTRQIYPYVEVCYRRNVRMTRSVAWKALGNHPVIGINIHSFPELIVQNKAAMLGIPQTKDHIRQWEVVFHNDRFQKDGFDTMGRIYYSNADHETVLRRELRVVTWGDDGLLVFDRITAEKDIAIDEQYLSPINIINDFWTGNQIDFSSGSLHEWISPRLTRFKEISCPSFWASIENNLLFQFLWGRTKGLVYLPSPARNSPAYWKNSKLDTLAVRVDEQVVTAGNPMFEVGFFIGAGKGPRPFKCTGEASEFFEGLIIMDGKNTCGL
jgi:hypothetical protein